MYLFKDWTVLLKIHKRVFSFETVFFNYNFNCYFFGWKVISFSWKCIYLLPIFQTILYYFRKRVLSPKNKGWIHLQKTLFKINRVENTALALVSNLLVLFCSVAFNLNFDILKQYFTADWTVLFAFSIMSIDSLERKLPLCPLSISHQYLISLSLN